MNITKSQLLKLVREELANVMRDRSLQERNPFHKGDGAGGGQFTSADKAATYSLTRKNKLPKDSKLKIQRGKVNKGNPYGKASAKMGQNFGKDQCGRKNMDGSDISPRFDCDDYKERYAHRYSEAVGNLESILQEMDLDESASLHPNCREAVRNFLLRLQRANAAVTDALKPPKKTDESAGGSSEPRPKSHYRGSPVSPVSRTTPASRSAKRKRKWLKSIGAEVPRGGFSRQERQLLNPDNFHEGKE
jgi:hypothetical protein